MREEKRQESEHLVRLRTKEGNFIDFYRDENKTVRITSSEGNEIKLPRASGMTTSQIFSMLEPLGEILPPEGEEEENGS